MIQTFSNNIHPKINCNINIHVINVSIYNKYPLNVSSDIRGVLIQVLSGGEVRREGISAARAKDVTRDEGDFGGAEAAGRGTFVSIEA